METGSCARDVELNSLCRAELFKESWVMKCKQEKYLPTDPGWPLPDSGNFFWCYYLTFAFRALYFEKCF